MVRIRVKIQAHDGRSRKPNLTHIMGKMGPGPIRLLKQRRPLC